MHQVICNRVEDRNGVVELIEVVEEDVPNSY
jgi:hypothetical protein